MKEVIILILVLVIVGFCIYELSAHNKAFVKGAGKYVKRYFTDNGYAYKMSDGNLMVTARGTKYMIYLNRTAENSVRYVTVCPYELDNDVDLNVQSIIANHTCVNCQEAETVITEDGPIFVYKSNIQSINDFKIEFYNARKHIGEACEYFTNTLDRYKDEMPDVNSAKRSPIGFKQVKL